MRPFMAFVLIMVLMAMICHAEKKDKRSLTIRKVEEYPAHCIADGLAIAADVISTDSAANDIFEYKNLVDLGIVPVLVIIENRGDFAVAIDGPDIYLNLANDKLKPLELPEIAGIVKAKKKSGGLRSPIPIPNLSTGDSKKFAQLESRAFHSKRIPPGISDYGFLFYHSRSHNILEEMRFLYLPKITNMKTDQDMIYFEIPLTPVRGQKP